ncbi:zinc knuckle CX2CX4HX4C containing protein [Tanacetum coccineum]
MEQYLALTCGNQAPGMVKPEITGNANFEIKNQFMRELREETFLGNKNENAHEHVERILDFVSLFNIPGVTHDVIMLRVFPITLTRAGKRWVDRLPLGTINTWDLLKKAFIQRYCPPSKMAKQLKEIHNFKQEDSQGPIPNKTPAQALDAIQTIADHSRKWHDESTSRKISNGSSDGIAAITNKLDSLGRDMKKLKENMHDIQVGCETYRGAHLNKECLLHEELIFDDKKPSLKELMNKHLKELTRRRAKMKEWMKKQQESTDMNTRNQNASLKNLKTQTEQLAKEYQSKAANELPNLSIGQCKAIFANDEALRDETTSDGTNELDGVSFISNDNELVSKKNDKEPLEVLPCHLPSKQLSLGSFTLPCTIGDPNETMILGRPLLATIHARIDVFDSEISLGVGGDRIIFYMNGNVQHPIVIVEKIKYRNCKIDDIIRARSFKEESRTSEDPYSKDLEEYKLVFDIEFKQLADEYELGIGNKRLLQQGDGTLRSPRLVVK